MPKTPNVILVLTDDQGYPPLGSNGHPFIQTPNLDEFHGDAVRFTDFHSGTTCAPTRSGLYTGHYCNSTGVWHTIGGRSLLRQDEWSIADAFHSSGYKTALFGKWHLGDEYPYRPQDRGFDYVVCHGGGGVSQQPDWWGNDYFDDTYLVNGEPKAFEGYCTDVFFNEALHFMEGAGSDPFLCVISTNAPHGPFNVDPKYRDLYTSHTESEAYARFLGMCTNIDENFGRLRAKLKELRIEENTILMFMSDNGQTGVGEEVSNQYNAGMRGMKGSPYEGGHRIPFLLRWPGGGVNGGMDIDTLSAYIDFMPTILDLCDVENKGHTFDGTSLAPLIRGEAEDALSERILVTDTQRVPHPLKWRLSCVMQNRWRLVNYDELYDLESDPSQTTNIAASHPEVVERLRDAYEAWWTHCTEGVDAAIPIPVGTPDVYQSVLRSHDLRNDHGGTIAWHQGHVRSGEFAAGWWEIDVKVEGEYEIELRRWPVESGHAVQAGIDGDDVEWDRQGVEPGRESLYSGGRAIAYTNATVIIDESMRAEAPIAADDECVALRLRLSEGQHHLRAILSSPNGEFTTAYYVHIRRLASVH